MYGIEDIKRMNKDPEAFRNGSFNMNSGFIINSRESCNSILNNAVYKNWLIMAFVKKGYKITKTINRKNAE